MSQHNTDTNRRTSARARHGRGAAKHAGPSAAVWIAVATLAAVLLVAGIDIASSAGRVHPGVTVGGVKVGGMSPARAAAALQRGLPEKSKSPVTVSYKDKTRAISPDDLGISFDYASLAAQAMGIGRSGGLLGQVRQRAAAWFGGAALPARAVAEQEKLDAVISEITTATDVPPQDATVTFDGMTPKVVGAKSGMVVNREELATALLTAFTSAKRQVVAPVHAAEADISDAAANAAKTVAENMVSAPATITYGKRTWVLRTRDIAKVISFRKVPPNAGAGWSLEPVVSEQEASATIAPKLGGKIGRPARDARFKTRSGRVTVIPSRTGVGPDIGSLAAELTAALKSQPGQPRVVALRMRKSEPRLSTAAARAMDIHDRISTFTTLYSSGTRPRVNNIHMLGDALDGKLIAPGATFSFNGAVGERTAAKGYVEAPAIVNGKLEPQLGGGICQVGTTLFNTVFLSGMPVIERHNHSFYISHYPKGRDATVSWGGPDLKFKNETKNWMLISVSYTSGSITISLYGTDPDYTVKSKTSAWSNERPFATEKTKDPKLAQGLEIIDDPGLTGRTCTVTRTVKKDGEIVRVDTFKSVYRPKIEVVRVGTKKSKSKNTTGSAGSD